MQVAPIRRSQRQSRASAVTGRERILLERNWRGRLLVPATEQMVYTVPRLAKCRCPLVRIAMGSNEIAQLVQIQFSVSTTSRRYKLHLLFPKESHD